MKTIFTEICSRACSNDPGGQEAREELYRFYNEEILELFSRLNLLGTTFFTEERINAVFKKSFDELMHLTSMSGNMIPFLPVVNSYFTFGEHNWLGEHLSLFGNISYKDMPCIPEQYVQSNIEFDQYRYWNIYTDMKCTPIYFVVGVFPYASCYATIQQHLEAKPSERRIETAYGARISPVQLTIAEIQSMLYFNGHMLSDANFVSAQTYREESGKRKYLKIFKSYDWCGCEEVDVREQLGEKDFISTGSYRI